VIFLISASQVAEITGVSHLAQPVSVFVKITVAAITVVYARDNGLSWTLMWVVTLMVASESRNNLRAGVPGMCVKHCTWKALRTYIFYHMWSPQTFINLYTPGACPNTSHKMFLLNSSKNIAACSKFVGNLFSKSKYQFTKIFYQSSLGKKVLIFRFLKKLYLLKH
jgi:hypothetical protein